ncbi:GAP family protein [Arthrobacter sp. SX1312]|uniref:GAP family protein n=1 Tax=Arthrobacter sp. SX1312 TaxID=2058896 RepID=UPI0015E20D71|nr:GAP family protein [Arthrobacter sp. SX1312]
MLSLLISLLPVAFAGTMSTVPASVTIIILLSSNALRGAWSFLIGSFAGALLLVGGAAVGLRFLPVREGPDQNVKVALVGLVVAAALIGYGIYLLSHTRGTDSAARGRMRTRVGSARSWEFLVLGLALNLRPKAILLSLTAGTLIGLQGLGPLAGTLVVLAYVLIAQSEIVVPIVLRMRRPERADALLTRLDLWLQHHSQTITGITLLVAGVFIAGLGIARL